MDWNPVKSPNAAQIFFRKTVLFIISQEQGIPAVLA
jgi:hypothetical protein